MLKKVFFCFLILVFCKNSEGQDFSFKPKFSTVLDTSVGYWALWQCSRASPKGVKNFWMPVEFDIKKLEGNFIKLLQVYGDPKRGGGKLDSLNGYVIQYVGVIIKRRDTFISMLFQKIN